MKDNAKQSSSSKKEGRSTSRASKREQERPGISKTAKELRRRTMFTSALLADGGEEEED
jgi:hypothetical protein